MASRVRSVTTATRTDETVLKLTDVSVTYGSRGGLFSRQKAFEAVRHADLSLSRGRTLALVGESGSGSMVMTDWFGGKDAVAQMVAGNDMLQPGLPKHT